MTDFNNPFFFEGRMLENRHMLAEYLSKHFKKCLSIIKNGSLFEFFQIEDNDFYQRITEETKDFECFENILTYIIYLLDNNMCIVTSNYQFKSNYDIADVMKKNYPHLVDDVKILFKDMVLAKIFWNEYLKTGDSKYKRNYTFMVHIYENRMYEFTYYYYLFLHLDKNETIRFTLDGIKMKSVAEIAIYLSNNATRASMVISEIFNNSFILALIALHSGIDLLAQVLTSSNPLAILTCLAKATDVDLIPIIKGRMAYWLIFNYQNYNYETEKAKELFIEYAKLNRNLNLNNISDYVNIYDVSALMYQNFLALFNHNKIVEYKSGISAQDEYYLSYRFNDEYVCEKFLKDNNLFDENIYSDVYKEEIEREILVDSLEEEKAKVSKFKEDVTPLVSDLIYDKKTLKNKYLISIMYTILCVASLVATLLIGYLHKTSGLDEIIHPLIFILLIVASCLSIYSLKMNKKKIEEIELVENILEACDVSIDVINEEERIILNPLAPKSDYSILLNLNTYKQNRDNDYKRLIKINKNGINVLIIPLMLGALLFVMPAILILTPFILELFSQKTHIKTLGVLDSNLIIALVGFVISGALLIIFRKKNFPYFILYIFMMIEIILSLFIF